MGVRAKPHGSGYAVTIAAAGLMRRSGRCCSSSVRADRIAREGLEIACAQAGDDGTQLARLGRRQIGVEGAQGHRQIVLLAVVAVAALHEAACAQGPVDGLQQPLPKGTSGRGRSRALGACDDIAPSGAHAQYHRRRRADHVGQWRRGGQSVVSLSLSLFMRARTHHRGDSLLLPSFCFFFFYFRKKKRNHQRGKKTLLWSNDGDWFCGLVFFFVRSSLCVRVRSFAVRASEGKAREKKDAEPVKRDAI